MTIAIEKRIEALEASRAHAWRWVWRNEGETDEQAKEREGIRPDEKVIVISWVENAL